MEALSLAVGTTAATFVVGMAAWGAVSPASQIFGPTVRFTSRANTIALTFDDGPNPDVTPRLLDLLERHRARATFFLIGGHVRACGSLAAEIAARGHAIGNHTDTHPNLTWMTPARIIDELFRCREAIESATGRPPRWMRPPYGFRGPQLYAQARKAGYLGVVMWSAMARDWRPHPPARLIQRLRRVRERDIVLLHDGDHRALRGDRAHVVAALEYWLPRWSDAGWQFITVDDCLAGSL
jgi:peptidoglycan/xylan/chitin deacetylase (PgdA/CDA1 family)